MDKKSIGEETVARLKRFVEAPSDARYWCSYNCPDCGTWMREKMTLSDMRLRVPCKACRERN